MDMNKDKERMATILMDYGFLGEEHRKNITTIALKNGSLAPYMDTRCRKR